MSEVQFTDVSINGVASGNGHIYHFTIDSQPVYVERWVTENGSGQDAYMDGSPVDLDVTFVGGTHDRVSDLIDAFERYYDGAQVRQLEDALVKMAITLACAENDEDDEGDEDGGN